MLGQRAGKLKISVFLSLFYLRANYLLRNYNGNITNPSLPSPSGNGEPQRRECPISDLADIGSPGGQLSSLAAATTRPTLSTPSLPTSRGVSFVHELFIILVSGWLRSGIGGSHPVVCSTFRVTVGASSKLQWYRGWCLTFAVVDP